MNDGDGSPRAPPGRVVPRVAPHPIVGKRVLEVSRHVRGPGTGGAGTTTTARCRGSTRGPGRTCARRLAVPGRPPHQLLALN
jgi:hypothetical protein